MEKDPPFDFKETCEGLSTIKSLSGSKNSYSHP